jgi:hypothetical protein
MCVLNYVQKKKEEMVNMVVSYFTLATEDVGSILVLDNPYHTY